MAYRSAAACWGFARVDLAHPHSAFSFASGSADSSKELRPYRPRQLFLSLRNANAYQGSTAFFGSPVACMHMTLP